MSGTILCYDLGSRSFYVQLASLQHVTVEYDTLQILTNHELCGEFECRNIIDKEQTLSAAWHSNPPQAA